MALNPTPLVKFKLWVKQLYARPLEDNPKPACFRGNCKSYLRYLHREHFWRWIRFSTIGFVLMGMGFGILFLSVSMAGLKPVLGYLIENLILVQIDFVFNRYFTFGDRDVHWFRALLKWYAARGGTFAVGQAIFFGLVHFFGLQYLLASLTIALTVGMFGYFINNVFTFASREVRVTN